MELQYEGVRVEEGTPVHEAISAARYYTTRDGQEPWLFAYTPVVRVNPFQQLCYRSFGEHGFAVAPVTDPWSFRELTALKGQVRGIILHVHWLSFVLDGATTPREAAEKTNVFMARLRAFRQEGGKVVWTVHNRVVHDATFMDEELRLQQSVAQETDLIHVLSDDTPTLVNDVLTLPAERTISVSHPSYLDAYEDYLPQDHARMMLGIGSDEVVYVVMGAIKAYKGIESLVEAFNRVLQTSDVPRRLIVAGAADRDRETRSLVKQLRMHPYVLLHENRVPGNHVQRLLRAADLMVLPHQDALNSGGALLGPTFNLPIVANRVGVLPGLLGEAFTEFSMSSTAEAMAEALLRADRLLTSEARQAATAFAREHHSSLISPRLAGAIRDGLALDGDGARP